MKGTIKAKIMDGILKFENQNMEIVFGDKVKVFVNKEEIKRILKLELIIDPNDIKTQGIPILKLDILGTE